MLKEQARVIRVVNRQAEIKMLRQSVCAHCDLSQGCGMGAIGRLLGHRHKHVVIHNDIDLKPGDLVVLGLSDRVFLGASLLIYGLPILTMLVASSLGHWMSSGSEMMTLLAAVAGFVSGLLVSATLAKSKFSKQLYPRILQINSEPIDQF
ncbi:MAG: SoxR reducing system RseC family protein [Gammaproteobacteria bacterium]|nr:SoxR reducing system RseC family protein [Gammaproteobacteria bacterium]